MNIAKIVYSYDKIFTNTNHEQIQNNLSVFSVPTSFSIIKK